MEKASDNPDYAPLCEFLKKEGTKKAQRMLKKIEKMTTNGEFIDLKIELRYRALLRAF